MLYRYDFGDDWRHEIVLEQVLPARHSVSHPICLDGQGHGPPEDVGGVLGYEEFLRPLSYRYLLEYRPTRKWAGGDFDPDEFDLETVNSALSTMAALDHDVRRSASCSARGQPR